MDGRGSTDKEILRPSTSTFPLLAPLPPETCLVRVCVKSLREGRGMLDYPQDRKRLSWESGLFSGAHGHDQNNVTKVMVPT